MMKNKVSLLLLTCGTNACYHVAKRLKECFGERVRIVGTDINKGWMISSWPSLDVFYQCPLTSDASYYSFILNICVKECVDYIMPSFDADQRLFYKGNPDLDKLGVKSLGVSEAVLDIYSSKFKTNSFLASKGFPIPRCFSMSEVIPDEEYFCKPSHGVGSVGAKRLVGNDILALNNDDFLIEEICEGPEVTLECFNYKGKVYSIARKRLEMKSGVCTKAYVYYDQELEAIAQRFADIIELPYIFNLQFMVNLKGTNVITDVNLRTAGGMSLSCAAGWDEVAALGKIMLEEDDVVSTVNVHPKEQYVIRAYTDIVTKQIKKRLAFDLDGTLLDSRKRHMLVMDYVLHEKNLDIDPSDLLKYKSDGHNNVDWLVSKGLSEEDGQKINKRWIELIEEEQFLAEDTLYSNTIEILTELSSYNSLVLITARNNQENAIKQIEGLGLKQYFDQIIIVETSSRTSECKANSLINMKIDEFYGDTESDMKAALKAGCSFYVSTRGFRSAKYWSNYDVNYSTYLI